MNAFILVSVSSKPRKYPFLFFLPDDGGDFKTVVIGTGCRSGCGGLVSLS